jgi:hypothetical protein
MVRPAGGGGFRPRYINYAKGGVLLVILALGYFAWWQLAVAAALIAVGVEVWWRGRQPRPGKDSAISDS